MALNAANTTLKVLDSAESVGANLYNTALVCIGVAVVVFLILVYFVATKDAQKKENLSNSGNPSIITLFGDFRGEDPLMLYKYYPGESLDRIFSAKLRSGTIKTGDHHIQIWSVSEPTSINSNPYTYLRDINTPTGLTGLNPAMYTLLADLSPNTEHHLTVSDTVEKIRLRVVPQ